MYIWVISSITLFFFWPNDYTIFKTQTQTHGINHLFHRSSSSLERHTSPSTKNCLSTVKIYIALLALALSTAVLCIRPQHQLHSNYDGMFAVMGHVLQLASIILSSPIERLGRDPFVVGRVEADPFGALRALQQEFLH